MADLYVPLDVNAPDDPKIIAAGDMGELVFYRSLCLAKRLQSDGFISTQQAKRLGATPKIVRALTVELWSEVEGGYQIASFLKRNPSRETVDAERRAAADRKASWRAGQHKAVPPMSPGTAPPSPTGPSLSELDLDSDSESEVKPLAPKTGARKRDPLFDAVATACGLEVESLTGTARGALNRALAELRGVKATPDDVPTRAANYHALYPGTAMTPTALAKHWPALARAAPLQKSRNGQAVDRVFAALETHDAGN